MNTRVPNTKILEQHPFLQMYAYFFKQGISYLLSCGIFCIITGGNLYAQPITASDCIQAHMLCSNGIFQVSPNGFGNTFELTANTVSNPSINPGSNNSGCLLLGERNSTWFMFRTYRPGTVEFSFGTPGPVQCFDWTMYRYSANICQDILNNQVAPIRCNWNSPCNSFTGVAGTLPPGGMMGNFEPPIQAGCEDTFLICFSNYGSIQSNVRFNYFGTASISCTPSPPLTITAAPPIICRGQNTILTGTGGFTSYRWTPTNTLNGDTLQHLAVFPNSTTTYRLTAFNGCRMDTAYTTVTVVEPPVISVQMTPVSRCDTCDGSIQVTLITPLTPQDYHWSHNLGNGLIQNNLCSGTRYFYYSYNGCQGRIPIAVTTPITGGQIQIARTPETCTLSDGTATISRIIGPPGPYTITWNTSPVQTGNTATGLSTGYYTVIVQDSASRCLLSAIFYIPLIGDFQTVATLTDATCPAIRDGRINTVTTGGIPPYLYLWSCTPSQTTPNATGLSAGTYNLMVTDSAGCVRNYIHTLSVGPPVNTWSAINPIGCDGWSDGGIQINQPQNSPPYTYVWNTQPVQTTRYLSGLSAGTYSVWIRDNRGCTTTVDIPIHNPPRLRMGVTTTDVSCYGMNNGSAIGLPRNPPVLYDVVWNLQPPQTNVSHINGLSPGTYSVTLSSRTGCINTDTFIITQPPPLITTGTSSPVFCHSVHTGEISLQTSGGSPPYQYNWSHLPPPGTGPAQLINLAQGTYSIITKDQNNCTDNITLQVDNIFNQIQLRADITAQRCAARADGEVRLQYQGPNPPYTISWNGGPPDTLSYFPNLITGSYQVRITDRSGCNKDTLLYVPLLPVNISASIQTQHASCSTAQNGKIQINNTSGSYPPFTFSLNNGPSTSQTYYPGLSHGTYPIRITDAAGCFMDTFTTLTWTSPSFGVSIQTQPATCSAGRNGSIQLTASGAYPPFTFAVNNGPVTSQTLYSGLSAGTYPIRITDMAGCYKDTFTSVTWSPGSIQPPVSQTPPDCFSNPNGIIRLDSNFIHMPAQFIWNTPSGTVTGTHEITMGAGTWSVQITDARNCSATLNGTLHEPMPLHISGTFIQPRCAGSQDGSISVSASGGTTPYSYSWNNQPAGNVLSGLVEGTYVILVNDSHGCADSVSILLTEPEPLVVNSSSTPSACPGIDDASISLLASGGTHPYRYYLNQTEYDTTLISQLPQGIYQIRVTDSMHCEFQSTITVESLDSILGLTQISHLRCNQIPEGEIHITGINGTAPLTYSCTGISDQTVPVFTGLGAGQYILQITDTRGCTWDTTVHLHQPDPILAKASFTEPDCYGAHNGQIRMEVKGGTPRYNYFCDPEFLSPSGIFQNVGSGTYQLRVSDAHGCSHQIEIKIPDGHRPEPPRVLHDTICPGESARLLAWTGDHHKNIWYAHKTDSVMLFSGDRLNLPEPKRSETFFVSSVDEKGCESEKIPVRVLMAQNPIAGFQADYETRELPGAIFSFKDISASQVPIYEWFWEFGDGETSSYQHPVHEYAQPGKFNVTLTVVDQNGCRAKVQKSAFLEVSMQVMMVTPNAFTPNGDGSNDYFKLPNYNIASWIIQIYDRWGNQIYQTEDLEFRWDGTLQGVPCAEAVYTYTVSGFALDHTPVLKTGTVLLMR